jgi:hypothetical protein
MTTDQKWVVWDVNNNCPISEALPKDKAEAKAESIRKQLNESVSASTAITVKQYIVG